MRMPDEEFEAFNTEFPALADRPADDPARRLAHLYHTVDDSLKELEAEPIERPGVSTVELWAALEKLRHDLLCRLRDWRFGVGNFRRY